MTTAEQIIERNYRIDERLGLLRDDDLAPTWQQLEIARKEADVFLAGLEREALLERVQSLAKSAARDKWAKRRFKS